MKSPESLLTKHVLLSVPEVGLLFALRVLQQMPRRVFSLQLCEGAFWSFNQLVNQYITLCKRQLYLAKDKTLY